jgi:hypothetical protein
MLFFFSFVWILRVDGLWLGKLIVAKVGAKDARTCEHDGGQDGLYQQPGVDLSNRRTVLIALHFSTWRVLFAVTSCARVSGGVEEDELDRPSVSCPARLYDGKKSEFRQHEGPGSVLRLVSQVRSMKPVR